jgi:exosortase
MGNESIHPADSEDAGLSLRTWGCVWGAVGILFVVNYLWTLHDLWRGWQVEGKLISGVVVLLAAGFLAWERRDEVGRAPVRPSRWGWVFVLGSGVLLFVGTRAGLVFAGGMSSVFLRGMSAAACVAGIVLLMWGWKAMAPLWLPLGLVAFIYPENFFTSLWIPLRLQALAAGVSQRVVTMLGYAVIRRGNVLETVGFTANVEEACSGIKSLLMVVPTALFIAGYGLRKLRWKGVLVLLAVPLTVAANVFRVTTTMLLGIWLGREVAEGFFHLFAGLGIYVLCLVGLWGIYKFLERMERADEEAPGDRTGDAGVPAGWRKAVRTPVVVVGLTLVLTCGVAYQSCEFLFTRSNSQKYPNAVFAKVPARAGSWEGKKVEMPEDRFEARHWTDYLAREYRSEGNPGVAVFALYWKRGGGTLLGRRTHLPASCYPYNGMLQRWSEASTIELTGATVRRVRLQHNLFADAKSQVLVSSWRGTLERGAERDIPRGRLELAAYGMRELLSIGGDYPPEVAFQFITPVAGRTEEVAALHREFARIFLPPALAALTRPKREPSRQQGQEGLPWAALPGETDRSDR